MPLLPALLNAFNDFNYFGEIYIIVKLHTLQKTKVKENSVFKVSE